MRQLVGIACLSWLALATSAQSPTDKQPAEVALPKPTGKYAVGTRTWYWVDNARLDELTPEPKDNRRMMGQLWYPAAANARGQRATYMPLYGWHPNVRGHSRADVPFAELGKPAPVIVICPGRGSSRHYYTSVAEDLASHGYAVLALDSPHSGIVVTPDGTVLKTNPKYKPSSELMAGPYEKVDEFFTEAATLGSQDVAFALRELEHLGKTDGLLHRRMDLEKIGIFGHSLGGRIAGAAAAADKRVKAYASMEGIPPRAVRQSGMDAAVLLMMSEDGSDDAEAHHREVTPKRRNDVRLVRLTGFGHNSVTDEPLIDPKRFTYKVDAAVGLEVTRTVLRTHFDCYLRGEAAAYKRLDGSTDVKIKHFPKP